MPNHGAFFVFYIAFCLSTLTGCWEGIPRRVLSTVLAVRGEVLCRSGETDAFRQIQTGANPSVGSILRTSDGAGLDIELVPGMRLRLSDDSELKIDELKLVKNGDETAGEMLDRVARIHLNQGKATLYFEQPEDSTGQFTVITDRVTISAKSLCLFQIQTDKTTTRVTCVRGEVYASYANGPPSVIGEGYFQEWPAALSKPISTASDSRGQLEMVAAQKAAHELHELEPDEPVRLR